jgi:hypothetical protein
VLHQNGELSLDAVRKSCESRLGAYKLPKSINLAKQIARNTNGKMLKNALRQKKCDRFCREPTTGRFVKNEQAGSDAIPAPACISGTGGRFTRQLPPFATATNGSHR